jgi:hypothetical protein
MQRDYIMRLIEQAAAMLASIFAKADAGRPGEATQDLNTLCEHSIGLDLASVKDSSPDEVGFLLAQSGALRYARSITLAEILLADATLREREPDAPFPLKNLVHAFCLLSDSIDVLGSDDEKAYCAKLHAVAARLEPYRELPGLKARFERLDGESETKTPAGY